MKSWCSHLCELLRDVKLFATRSHNEVVKVNITAPPSCYWVL